MNCINHPKREAVYFCFKHKIGYCGECCKCIDREKFCKYRPTCTIWAICKTERIEK
jgi:hypothetical protein